MWWTFICIVIGAVSCVVGFLAGYTVGIRDCENLSKHAYEAGRKLGYKLSAGARYRPWLRGY